MKDIIDEVKVGDLSRDEKLKLLSKLLEEFAKEEKIEELNVPVSIFNEKLGSLESIVKYLKEELKLSNKKIGKLLNRDNRTIWTIYNNAKKKRPLKLDIKANMFVPLKILKPRKLSVLESIVYYLKKHYDLNYHEIAVHLKRDDRTIWTVYQRAKNKAG